MLPNNTFPASTLLRAQGVRVALFDVDGVLTDGSLYYSDQGETLKRFHSLDGHGFKLLMQGGITPVVISGRDSGALRLRLHQLGVTRAFLGTENKLPMALEVLQELGCGWEQCACMGDDWPDLPVMRRALFSCAPPQAHAEVAAYAHYVTQRRAGAGAAREFCDLLLCASGRYADLLDGYTR